MIYNFSKIVIAAVKDDGQTKMTQESYSALSLITGESDASLKYRSSFAMIGFSETKKPHFVKVVRCVMIDRFQFKTRRKHENYRFRKSRDRIFQLL